MALQLRLVKAALVLLQFTVLACPVYIGIGDGTIQWPGLSQTLEWQLIVLTLPEGVSVGV